MVVRLAVQTPSPLQLCSFSQDPLPEVVGWRKSIVNFTGKKRFIAAQRTKTKARLTRRKEDKKWQRVSLRVALPVACWNFHSMPTVNVDAFQIASYITERLREKYGSFMCFDAQARFMSQ